MAIYKINYAKYKLILKAQKSYYKSFSNKITVNANVTDEGAMAEIKNTSSTRCLSAIYALHPGWTTRTFTTTTRKVNIAV